MRRLLIGTTAALFSFAFTRASQRKSKQPEQSEITWISADDVVTLEPLFELGEEVITFNPYTSDYALMDFDGSPLYFQVEDVLWDEDDECFRYRLKENDQWFAETWLMTPEHPYMEKPLLQEEESEVRTELTVKAKDANIRLQVDYWLATLQDAKQAGDAKAYEEATKALEELTAK